MITAQLKLKLNALSDHSDFQLDLSKGEWLYISGGHHDLIKQVLDVLLFKTKIDSDLYLFGNEISSLDLNEKQSLRRKLSLAGPEFFDESFLMSSKEVKAKKSMLGKTESNEALRSSLEHNLLVSDLSDLLKSKLQYLFINEPLILILDNCFKNWNKEQFKPLMDIFFDLNIKSGLSVIHASQNLELMSEYPARKCLLDKDQFQEVSVLTDPTLVPPQ